MKPQIGKRYQCESCGTAILCLKPGSKPFECCGKAMEGMSMEQLPSGD